ncbi:MAG: LPS export ABC transporter periplasmic protein LptC [Desulfatibacillaceae bacterium]
MRSYRHKAVITALAAFLLVLLALVALQRRPGPDNPLPGAGQDAVEQRDAQVVLSDVVHHATKSGERTWSMTAGSMELAASGKTAAAADIDMVFHAEQGREVSVRAPRAEIDMETDDVTLSGGVEIRDGRYTMKAEKMHYEAGKKVFTTPGSVLLASDNASISGDRLEYHLDSETALLTGGVKARLGRENGA